MSSTNYPKSRYVSGAFKRTCDASGFDYLSTELVRQWNGSYVHPKYLDPIPLDIARRRRPVQPPLRIF